MVDQITEISRWLHQEKVNFDLPFKQLDVNDGEERATRNSSQNQRMEITAVEI